MRKKFFLLIALFTGTVTGAMAETIFSADVITNNLRSAAIKSGTKLLLRP